MGSRRAVAGFGFRATAAGAPLALAAAKRLVDTGLEMTLADAIVFGDLNAPAKFMSVGVPEVEAKEKALPVPAAPVQRARAEVPPAIISLRISVERIDYDYPEYTGFVDRSVERLGDIRAIEGTRVTIHARANGRSARCSSMLASSPAI